MSDQNSIPRTDEKIAQAADQLNRTLAFFPRVDTKSSFLFGINAAMLALLIVNAPPIRSLQWYMVFAATPVLLLAASFWHLHSANKPTVSGGEGSLLYFRRVADQRETQYLRLFRDQTNDQLLDDLLGQVWRNSQILKEKFDHVEQAFNLLAWCLLPWVVTLCMFASANTHATSLLVK